MSETPSPSPAPSQVVSPPGYNGLFQVVSPPGYNGLFQVVSPPGYNGLLRRKITVRVEFWKLVYGVANGPDNERLSDGTRPGYYFVVHRVKRVGLHADASAERKTGLRAFLHATDRSATVFERRVKP